MCKEASKYFIVREIFHRRMTLLENRERACNKVEVCYSANDARLVKRKVSSIKHGKPEKIDARIQSGLSTISRQFQF